MLFSKLKPYHVLLKKGLLFCVVAGSSLFIFCTFPYTPEPEPALTVTNEGNKGKRTRVFQVNGTKQICNPSIALDTIHFPGCMLWLNFSGELPVTIPDDMSSFSKTSLQHDRLTIVDTTNTVRWFMKRDEFGADEREELQDPEWAAHPDYIVCLLSAQAQKQWGCYVIHPNFRKKMKICSKGLGQTSTPHLWVEQNASFGVEPQEVVYDSDGFADTASITQFFTTTNVKIVAAKATGRVLSLYYKDFANKKGLIPLRRPVNREGWNCESPLISPDGHWIVFNAYKTTTFYEIYIQELLPESTPILFKTGASDPHWWVHPVDATLLYVLYQEVPGGNLVSWNENKISVEEILETAELGITYRQLIRLFQNAATGSVALSRIGYQEALVNFPTKGGLSPDGRYLCTGYDRAFIVGLP